MPKVERENWRITYQWSQSSGLRLGAAEYQGMRVFHAASVPFLYVKYGSDAYGPFSDELRSQTRDVVERAIVNGFDLVVKYDFYGADYEYDHIWRFHDDGQFGSVIVIHGPGEEIFGHHIYHIPFRFDLDLSGASGDSFQRRGTQGSWQDVALEGRHLAVPGGHAGFDWRVIDKATGKSARLRARTGDSAEVWALRYKAAEAWGSWGGVEANTPGSEGSVPAVYNDGQSVQNSDIVLWYIAHVGAADRVSACGPWFALDGFPPPLRDEGPPDHHQGHGAHHDEGSPHRGGRVRGGRHPGQT
jgi:hypothetical protein